MKDNKKAIKISGLFSSEKHRQIQEFASKIYEDKNQLSYNEMYRRFYVNDLPYFKKLHFYLLDLAKEVFEKNDLKLSFSHLFFCDHQSHVSHPHFDLPPCQYSINYCISQGGPWPFYIEEEPFYFGPNEALLYAGTVTKHHRPRMEDKNNFSHLVLFHYVDSTFL